MKIARYSLLLAAWIVFAQTANAQQLIIYPKMGQTQAQMEADKGHCYAWAKGQTGFDPMATYQTSQRGGALKGAAGGALLGMAVGSLAGEAGKGAAIGAAGGGLFGGMRQRSRVRQQQNAYNQQITFFKRAYGACLEAKGYTVR